MSGPNTLKRVTRADVAKEAGVSETIVSYVINGNRYVDDLKRRKVQKAVAKLNYHPSPMARALKGKKSNHILFIADDLMSEHFGKIISEMEKIAYDDGCFISLCSDRTDRNFLSSVYNRSFDGVIIGSGTIPDTSIQTLIDSGVPVVLLEIRSYSRIRGVYGKINTGLYGGARKCVELLQKKNRRHIVYADSLSPEGLKINKADFRYQGYRDQMEAKGLPRAVIDGCRTEDELAKRFLAYFGRHEVDGVFCRTDTIACTVMRALQDKGIRIPKDVSIAGFNNSRISRYVTPRLTTMEIRRDLVGQNAMAILKRLTDEKKELTKPLFVQLETELVERDSV
ncbi:LacI family DNA-binding transcriptional regulator [Breznakiella homolactica]|uniref:LacI family DNA-binding transcriptional regulator n=1 Tax=Breznakiella homolactica TaxID=2798577 RepID=A0A7T8B922_9SPIR|nr:LacI family DNA-binding transcriptional regulator [Breznakiella homolactica]QQO07896.1 LacI family transcriptional regulator [Breznakiella homolactica]